MEKTEYRIFSLSEELLRQKLADVLDDSAASLSYEAGEGILSVTASPETVADMTEVVTQRLGSCVYSLCGETLEQRVVAMLTAHGKTVATAESCTGGLVSSRLTGVSGSSRVFGTGVVSYSWDCKQNLLQVPHETLQREGAVSAVVAGQMARGVRQTATADIGVSVTGEAGPNPAEKPVGTVFIALADAKRTWVCELHLEGERESIRRQAANHVLFLLYRYLEAYPTVMAGGISNRSAQRSIPRTQGDANPRMLSRLLPWRGDSFHRILLKCSVWVAVLALLGNSLYAGYRYLLAPDINRQLQDSLGEVYRDEPADLTVLPDTAHYPAGMMAQFRGLYDRNKDVGGWIHIEDTAVDYPVMLYSDGKYSNQNFDNQYSLYGQPYFGAHTDLSDRVLTVYGRNTEDGQMFSELLNYRRIAFLQEHATVALDTLYDAARWRIFAVLVVDENAPQECPYSVTAFADEGAYGDYIAMLRERSLFDSDCAVTAEDRLLLLSVNAETAYGFSSARLVIAACRVDVGEQATVSYWVNPHAKLPSVLSQQTTTGRPVYTTAEPTTTTTETTTTTTTTTLLPSSTITTTVTTQPPTTETTTTQESTTATASSTASSTTSSTVDVVAPTESTESTTLSTEPSVTTTESTDSTATSATESTQSTTETQPTESSSSAEEITTTTVMEEMEEAVYADIGN